MASTHGAAPLLSVFIGYVAAQAGAECAERLRLPTVSGAILAGAVVGPSCLGLYEPDAASGLLAELGAVLLLFSVGLESRVGELLRVGRVAVSAAVLGVVLPFAAGASWGWYEGMSPGGVLFAAAAFTATSAGVTGRVLRSLGALSSVPGRVILGAAVVDDILAVLVLGVVTSVGAGHGAGVSSLAAVTLGGAAFVSGTVWSGTKIVRARPGILDAPVDPLSPLTLSLALCLGLAAAAAWFGLAAIIGAFLAGVIIAEAPQAKALVKEVDAVAAFLVPFFFVHTGAGVDLPGLASPPVFAVLIVVTALAAASKIIGCGLGALPLGGRSALAVGVGMVPRGEVGVLVASLGLGAGVFDGEAYSVVVGMSVLTSVAAPLFLGRLLREGGETDPSPRT